MRAVFALFTATLVCALLRSSLMRYVLSVALVGLAAAAFSIVRNDPGEAAFPGVPGKIAFETNSDGNYEIYVVNRDGSGRSNLTQNPFADYSPAWSPDGGHIAFQTYRDGNAEIYVMNADGSGLINLTSDPSQDITPRWSPDGAKIAFASNRNGNHDIYVMNSDGTNPVGLTDNPAHEYGPAFSPDGAGILYTSEQDGNIEIYRMTAAGGDPVNLTNRPDKDDESADWSPDGTKIVFNRGSTDRASASFKIWAMNADGSGQVDLSGGRDGGEFDPSWSPDGKLIMFSRTGAGSGDDLFVMGPDGSNLTNLTNSETTNEQTSAWQSLPPATGDADCDAEVDSVDALQLLRAVAGLTSNICAELAGNVKCDDGLTAVDSLFILRYVAQLPVNLPPGCPEIGAVPASFGTGTLDPTWEFDFDTGAQAVPPARGDIWWSHIGGVVYQMEPSDGARIVNVGIVAFGELSLEDLKALSYGTDPINGSDDPTNLLVPGDVFAVLTSEGNYAKVLVVEYGAILTLQWVTYQP